MAVSKTNSHVAVKYIGLEDEYSYQQVYVGLKECLSNLGGIDTFVKKGQNVLIKVNAVNSNSTESGVTVSPLLCRALVDLSYKAGAQKVFVGDCSASGLSSVKTMTDLGIAKQIYEVGGELIGFEKDPKVECKIANGKVLRNVLLPQILTKVDVIISLAKAKTHVLDAITGCVKNWVGILPQRLGFHQEQLCQVVAELVDNFTPSLSLFDALVIGEGEGPNFVIPQKRGLIVAGDDPVATDVIMAELMGINSDELKFPRAAWMQGTGNFLREKIEVKGEDIARFRHRVLRANPLLYNRYPCNFVLGAVCGGCLSWLIGAMEGFTKRNLWAQITPKGTPTIAVGYNASDSYFKEHLQEGPYFIVGDCTIANWKDSGKVVFIPGCCPGQAIRSAILLEYGIN